MDQNIVRGQATLALTGTAYAGVLSVGDAAYVSGAKYIITTTDRSVEGATINLNAIGAVALVKGGRVKINFGDLIPNRKYECIYDGTNTEMVVLGLPNLITTYYDFSIHGGAQSTITLTSLIPTSIYLRLEDALISIETQLSSAGLALIQWGITGGIGHPGIIDAKRPFDDRTTYGRSHFGWSFRPFNVPYGTFEITAGAAGTIDTVTINGINILNGVVAYNTSTTITARDVAKNINSNPTNGIRASYSGPVVYLYLASLQKFCSDPFTHPVSATATTMTVGNFNNLGFAESASNVGIYANAYRPGLSIALSMTISGADLLGGLLRLSIPYEITQ